MRVIRSSVMRRPLSRTGRAVMWAAGVVSGLFLVLWAGAEPQEPTGFSLASAPDGTFTVAVIPDTQRYYGLGSTTDTNGTPRNPAFESRVAWIAKHVGRQRIVFVSHMGDIVDKNNRHQWGVARHTMDRLEGVVPYGLTVGNHDLTGAGDSSLFQEFFGAERFNGRTWYGGCYGGYPETGPRVSGNNANNFQLFSAEGLDFVILHLECNAPDDVLAWADGVLATHGRRLAIISTHMYLGPLTKAIKRVPEPGELGRMQWKKVHGKRGNTPQQLWEKCFSRHPNVFLILAGDQSYVIAHRQESRGLHGNRVHEVMQDYPRTSDDSDWLRLYRFNPAHKKIEVFTYSPAQNRLCGSAGYLADAGAHQFELDIADALGRFRK